MGDSVLFVVDSARVRFQSIHPHGQDYFWGLSPNIQAVLITVAASMLFFILGIYFKKRGDTQQRFAELGRSEHFVLHCFDSLLESSSRMVEVFDEYAGRIVPDFVGDNSPFIVADLNFDNARLLDRRIVFDSLVSNKLGTDQMKLQYFSELYRAVGAILGVQSSYRDRVRDFHENAVRKTVSLNESSDKFFLFYESLESSPSPVDVEMAALIRAKQNEMGPVSVLSEYAGLLRGIYDLASKHPTNAAAKECGRLCDEYVALHSEYIKLHHAQSQLFRENRDTLALANATLKLCLDFFRGLRVRTVRWDHPSG